MVQPKSAMDKAITKFKRQIRNDPRDGRGARYHLAPRLFERDRYVELEELLEEYKSDPSSWLTFTKALWLFKTSPGSDESQQALEYALTRNPYVYQFFAGFLQLPEELPHKIGIGDEREAACYVKEYGYQWENTQGALDWMNDTVANSITAAMSKFQDQISIDHLLGQRDPAGTTGDGDGCCDHNIFMNLESLIQQEKARAENDQHIEHIEDADLDDIGL